MEVMSDGNIVVCEELEEDTYRLAKYNEDGRVLVTKGTELTTPLSLVEVELGRVTCLAISDT